MKRSSLYLSLLLMLFSACATKKDLPEKVYDLFEKQADYFSDGESDEKIGSETKLPENFKLAIYFRAPEATNVKWKWTQEDKSEVFNAMEEFKDVKIDRIFELINTEGTQDYKSLRKMAAQQGADALLLVQGLAQVDSAFNPWALSYVAVAPLLFIEGNDVSSVFVSQALLWDVKRPYVHLGVQSEGEWSMKRPAVFKQKNRAIRKSREEAMQTLTQKLKKNFQEVVL